METITIHKAKPQLSRLMEKACRDKEIVLARGKEPAVRLVAIEDKRGDRKPGALKGKIHTGLEFFGPPASGKTGGLGVATWCASAGCARQRVPRIPVDREFLPFAANSRRFCGLR
jgi:antitoxin (DNA-binding transcriptional repressor) of toxin-antitoxin stability system